MNTFLLYYFITGRMSIELKNENFYSSTKTFVDIAHLRCPPTNVENIMH